MVEFYTTAETHKGKYYIRGYKNGKQFSEIVSPKPYLFIKSKEKSRYRNLRNEYVKKIDFSSLWEQKEFLDQYANVEGFEIYGFSGPMSVYAYLNDRYKGNIDYDLSVVKVLNFDIEVASDDGFPSIEKADKEVTSITMKIRDGETHVIGTGKFNPPDGVIYHKVKDEKFLLQKFLHIWNTVRPDIITGWNIEGFDVPYLYNRIARLFGTAEADKMSPFGITYERTFKGAYGSERKVRCLIGIKQLDYLELYKKFTFKNVESYSLNTISHIELNEKKLDYSEYKSLHDLYEKDYQKFLEYNIKDVELVDRLDKKLGFINQVMTIAYSAKVNFDDTLTTIRTWDVIIHNYLLEKGYVVPQMKDKDFKEIVGGYVKNPVPGLYKWIVSFDLNSLYPHLIMQYNISPENILFQVEQFKNLCEIGQGDECVDLVLNGYLTENKREELKKNNLVFSGSGTIYSGKRRGFLPELMDQFYNMRKVYKKKKLEFEQKMEGLKKDSEERKKCEYEKVKYDNMQKSIKILLNSLYGALTNQYFRWYDYRLGESITVSGQLSIRWIEKHLNEFMNKLMKTQNVDYVVAIDTDSCLMNFEPLVNKLFSKEKLSDVEIARKIDKLCEKLVQPVIDEAYKSLAEYMNAFEQKMFMKREKIANKGIWTAKKRYILSVINNEGVEFREPKIMMTGIEAVRSSTPEVCRNKIKDAIKIILTKSEQDLHKFVDEFYNEFKSLPFEEIAFPRGVNDIEKYRDFSGVYKKGTPIHVRASLLYNKKVLDMKLEKVYNTIKSGDKIKFAYLKMPNPVGENVIACLDIFPREFGLEKYIDYQLQFDKAFISPLKNIVDVIGWSTEPRAKTIFELFGKE